MSGGHERIFDITPSRFQYRRFKDDLHFYLTLGIVPLSALIFFINVFIGPAELTEIPEGYVPKHWEYYRHPVERFFARLFHHDPQVEYEKNLHHLNEMQERIDYNEQQTKVKHLMAHRDDYKGWYYVPSDKGRQYRYARKIMDDIDDHYGYR